MVAPSSTTPYRILVCLARSSAESMGDSILSTVRKAAKLAVYEEMMMRVKNHQMPPTIRVDRALGMSSEPGVKVGGSGRGECYTAKWVHLSMSSLWFLISRLIIKFIFKHVKKQKWVPVRTVQLVSRTLFSSQADVPLASRRSLSRSRELSNQDDGRISNKWNYLVRTWNNRGDSEKKFYSKTASWEQEGHLKINHIESNTFNTSRSEQGGEVTGCLGQRVMYPR